MYPARVGAALVLAVGAAATADQIGTQTTQLTAIRADPVHGLGLARRIAHLTYRSELELDIRFGNTAQGDGFAVQSYLDHHADKLEARFDAESYVTLTEAMNTHDVGRGRGGVAAALASIRTPMVVGGDHLRSALPDAPTARDRGVGPVVQRAACGRIPLRTRRVSHRDRRGRRTRPRGARTVAESRSGFTVLSSVQRASTGDTAVKPDRACLGGRPTPSRRHRVRQGRRAGRCSAAPAPCSRTRRCARAAPSPSNHDVPSTVVGDARAAPTVGVDEPVVDVDRARTPPRRTRRRPTARSAPPRRASVRRDPERRVAGHLRVDVQHVHARPRREDALSATRPSAAPARSRRRSPAPTDSAAGRVQLAHVVADHPGGDAPSGPSVFSVCRTICTHRVGTPLLSRS